VETPFDQWSCWPSRSRICIASTLLPEIGHAAGLSRTTPSPPCFLSLHLHMDCESLFLDSMVSQKCLIHIATTAILLFLHISERGRINSSTLAVLRDATPGLTSCIWHPPRTALMALRQHRRWWSVHEKAVSLYAFSDTGTGASFRTAASANRAYTATATKGIPLRVLAVERVVCDACRDRCAIGGAS
jgi:hypothetical protein